MGEYKGSNIGQGFAGAALADGKTNGKQGETLPPIVEHARDVAAQVTSEAKELVNTKILRRQERSAMELTSIANVLREKGEELEESVLGPLIGKAADEMDRASDFIKDATVTDVVRSTERFARREPLLFLGGAFTLGLFAARFLRSSGHHRDDDARADEGAAVRP